MRPAESRMDCSNRWRRAPVAASFLLAVPFAVSLALLALVGAAPAAAESVAIVGGKVATAGPAGTIDGATVVLTDGRVAAVGREVAVPAGARVIDATGKWVTPGLFDSGTELGVTEVSAVDDTGDAEVEDDRITAAFRVADSINPASTLIPVNRVEGLTRALVVPDTGSSLIAGQAAVIDLGLGPDLVEKTPAAMVASYGESGARLAGGARGAALLRLREALQEARDYAANRDAWERNQHRGYALSHLDLEALQPVVRGELPLLISANRASDLLTLLDFAAAEKVRLVIAGAAEGWRVAERLAAAGVPVLIDPLVDLPEHFESLGATLENAARLAAASVTVAFLSGDSHNARNLRQAAGNAVAYGMPWEAALAAMTSVPARLWGIDDVYGTLAPGKDGDVVVWDGDPLEVTSYPEQVWIRGRQMPMETRQRDLRDRYLHLPAPGELPPAYVKP